MLKENSSKTCLLLINKMSGRGSNIDIEKTSAKLKAYFSKVDLKTIKDKSHFNITQECEGYDYLAVSGGDGTLNSAINCTKDMAIKLIYIPSGTLNDTYNTLKHTQNSSFIDLGEVNGKLFSYVLAAGSFTPIGYITNSKLKQRFKQLAYFIYAFKEYKIHNIRAEIETNEIYQDNYTLIMIINSRRVFGFPFNRLYENNSGKAHLLLIKAPKGNYFSKLIKMFFLFFRTFFIGFKKPVKSKNIVFQEIDKVNIKLFKEEAFCIDGEKLVLDKDNKIIIHKSKIELLYLE